LDKSIQDEDGNNQMSDLDNVMALRNGRKIRHKKKSVKKKKKDLPPKLGIHLIKGKGSLLPPTSIIQNDWSYLELSGLGRGVKIEFLTELIRKERIGFIGLQETNKKSFEDSWLNSISGNRNFAWFWTLANGRSGGLLVGFNVDAFDVRETKMGDFMIKVLLVHKENVFI
jgi:hypothetical protein